MSILIARLETPSYVEADPIPQHEIKSAEIQKLIQDLLDTVEDASGAGLVLRKCMFLNGSWFCVSLKSLRFGLILK